MRRKDREMDWEFGIFVIGKTRLTGYKPYAPKCIEALFIRDEIRIEPLIHGAGRKSGRMAGTENIILEVG